LAVFCETYAIWRLVVLAEAVMNLRETASILQNDIQHFKPNASF
jgi:hypothetical protein